jgi:hypothetical protein
MRLRVLSVISHVQNQTGHVTTVRISRVIRVGSGTITLPDRSVLRFRTASDNRPGSVIVVTSNNPIVPPFVVDLRFD